MASNKFAKLDESPRWIRSALRLAAGVNPRCDPQLCKAIWRAAPALGGFAPRPEFPEIEEALASLTSFQPGAHFMMARRIVPAP